MWPCRVDGRTRCTANPTGGEGRGGITAGREGIASRIHRRLHARTSTKRQCVDFSLRLVRAAFQLTPPPLFSLTRGGLSQSHTLTQHPPKTPYCVVFARCNAATRCFFLAPLSLSFFLSLSLMPSRTLRLLFFLLFFVGIRWAGSLMGWLAPLMERLGPTLVYVRVCQSVSVSQSLSVRSLDQKAKPVITNAPTHPWTYFIPGLSYTPTQISLAV
ncbi:hypothetical protein LY76DRAFT_163676 [Colletotrichum caudatum]|nr:hypothetical protein LY76DRAFT_163676 [Colletotrichum caudatum]